MTTYQENAQQVLNSMNVTFFVKDNPAYGQHFADDKTNRYIFTVGFKRGKDGFSLKFGQSIQKGRSAPTAYDVISCIQKYDVGSFEDFCSEFGYDTYSRKAYKIYKAVCDEFDKVSTFFTSEELEVLNEIQ